MRGSGVCWCSSDFCLCKLFSFFCFQYFNLMVKSLQCSCCFLYYFTLCDGLWWPVVDEICKTHYCQAAITSGRGIGFIYRSWSSVTPPPHPWLSSYPQLQTPGRSLMSPYYFPCYDLISIFTDNAPRNPPPLPHHLLLCDCWCLSGIGACAVSVETGRTLLTMVPSGIRCLMTTV